MLQIAQKNRKPRTVNPSTESLLLDNISTDLNIIETSLTSLLEYFDANKLLELKSCDVNKLLTHFEAVTKLFDNLLQIEFNNEVQPQKTFAFLINKIISKRVADWSTGHNKASQIAKTFKMEEL